jgi:acyl-CoA synthetase (AMP-forming)/AMP-acid ligase II
VLPGETIAIVQPDTRTRLGPGQVGEIWIQGPHVALGYWEKPEETGATFRAKLAGEAEAGEWLRTGDLGCVDAEGEIYIAGRLKDMMIVRGANFYPQDLELTAEKCHPALRRGYGAAFTEARDATQLLVMVHEVERSWLNRIDVEAVTSAIRAAIVEQHQLTVHQVVLVTPGSIPKTTSGKIRRRATRDLWRTQGLSILPSAHAPRSSARAVATQTP